MPKVKFDQLAESLEDLDNHRAELYKESP